MKSRLIYFHEFSSPLGGSSHSVKEGIIALLKDFDILLVTPHSVEWTEFAETLKITHLQVPPINLPSRRSFFELATKGPVAILRCCKVMYKLRNALRSDDILVANGVLGAFIINLWQIFGERKKVYFIRGFINPHGLFRWILFSENQLMFAVTQSVKTHILENFPELRKRVWVLHNFIPRSFVNKIKKSHGGNKYERAVTIGVVGYVGSQKNQIRAVEMVFKLLNQGFEVKLKIFGVAFSQENNKYKEKLENRISNLNLEKYVTLEGYAEKVYIYRTIDILLSTSLTEGFGKTIIEGMVAGVPVVAFAGAGGPRDLIRSWENGVLINNLETSELELAVGELCKSKKLRESLGMKARLFALEKFSEKIWRKKVREKFRSLSSIDSVQI